MTKVLLFLYIMPNVILEILHSVVGAASSLHPFSYMNSFLRAKRGRFAYYGYYCYVGMSNDGMKDEKRINLRFLFYIWLLISINFYASK